MKNVQRPRSEVRPDAWSIARSTQRGFTLVELMVSISILGIVAAIAFGALRQDEFAGSYAHFIEDISGDLVQARHIAIDDQTRVQVQFTADRMEVRSYNPVTNVWDPVLADRIDNKNGGLLAHGGVCIYGLVSGAQAPGSAQDIAAPSSCLAAAQILIFEPDGTFTVPGNVLTLDNAGATLWIADRRVPSAIKLSMIQMFPGGLMRTFDHVD